MKAITKDFIAKKLFNFYTFFIIIALSYALPLNITSFAAGNSAFFQLIEKISFWLFDEKCIYSMYFPSFFISILPLGFLYILSEKIKTPKFAFLNCLILSTSLGYVLFVKMFLEESISVSFALCAIYCLFYTFFCSKEKEKYFWAFGIIFLILSALINFHSIFAAIFIILISSIIFKKSKKYILNLTIITTILLFITLFKTHPNFTIKPLVSIFTGAFPWIISLLFYIKRFRKLNLENNSDKFVLLNIISIFSIILCSITLNAPIALIYPFLSGIIGYIWYNYIFQNENKVIKCVLFLIIAFIVASIIGIFFPLMQDAQHFEFIKNILGL